VLFKIAVRVYGVSPVDFWSMTPIEFDWLTDEEKSLDFVDSKRLAEMEAKYPDHG